MTNPMSLAGRLSGLNLRPRFGKSARPRGHRVKPRWQADAQISLLEERCLLSDLGIALPTPKGGFVAASDVMYQINSTLKTITIHNDSTTQTLFPFVEDANTGVNGKLNQLYDPNDFPYTPAPKGKLTMGEEYRLYAGYTQGTSNFVGLPPGASITLTLPMVFWNAGTIQVVADSPAVRKRFFEPLEPTGNELGRPFLFNEDDAKEAVAAATATGEPAGAQGMDAHVPHQKQIIDRSDPRCSIAVT